MKMVSYRRWPGGVHDGAMDAAPPGALIDLNEQENLPAVQIFVA
jgi:hypothetical protein